MLVKDIAMVKMENPMEYVKKKKISKTIKKLKEMAQKFLYEI